MSAQAVRAWLPPQGPRLDNARRVAVALDVSLDQLYIDPNGTVETINVYVETKLDGQRLADHLQTLRMVS
jgi:hypothetical protein